MSDRIIGRCLFASGLVIFCLVFSFQAFAQNQKLSIFDVRKSIPLSESEPAIVDFYINGGVESGLKENMIITVHRILPMHDSYTNKSYGELTVPVAKIQVIFVQQKISVARLYKTIPRHMVPNLEYNAVMAGDTLDMSTAVFKARRKKRKVSSFKPKPTLPVVGVPSPNKREELTSGFIGPIRPNQSLSDAIDKPQMQIY